jgi:hypothetical protein
MKKFGIILSVVALAWNMISCLNLEEGDNYQGFGPEPVVVYKHNDTTGIRTLLGLLLAPELSDKNNGDCLIATYTVYFNKPELTASNIETEVVLQKPAILSENSRPEIAEGYTDSILTFIPVSYNANLDGKVFFQIACSAKKNSMVDFNMTFIHTPESTATNVFNAYLTAKLTSPETGTAERRDDIQVFDFKQIIREYGLDKTSDYWLFQTIKVNFYYFTGFDKNDQPVWQQVTSSDEYNYDIFQ